MVIDRRDKPNSNRTAAIFMSLGALKCKPEIESEIVEGVWIAEKRKRKPEA